MMIIVELLTKLSHRVYSSLLLLLQLLHLL